MHVEVLIIDMAERKQLLWYGHMRCMEANALPLKVWEWRASHRKGDNLENPRMLQNQNLCKEDKWKKIQK